MSHRSYELSHPQKRIWYTEMLYPDTAFANLAGSVVFKRQEVDFQLLKKAINWVIERHDALRIRLMSDDNCDIRQYISDYEEKDYETIKGELLENWMAERSSTAFSLMGADLYYFAMIKFSDGRCGYYFKYHHIICDAMTVTLLNKQIYCIYENLVNNEDVVIDTRIPSFTEFLERDKKYPAGETYAEDKAFWQREFIDIPAPVNLCSCVGSMSIRAERRVLNLGEEASAAINGFCRENHTTIFRFFMSVFYIYFLRTSSYSDIVIATGHHNRIAKEERQMAGMTVSTLPIRIKVDTGMNYIELLSCITKKVTDCLSHQQYPFELLASDLRERGSSPEGLLNIMLNHIPSLTEESYTVERYTPGFDPALYNIKINPNQLPKQAPLEIAVDYRRDAFDSAHIEGMFSRLRTLIEDIIVNPGKRLYELEIIPPEERFNLLNEFNSTRRHYPENVCFNDFFAEQVMKTPDNTALVYKDRAYTYRELDSKTNKLAVVLRRKGVRTETITAIMVNRSEVFLMAAIAVLKAGGAYLPVDPRSPWERIDYILADSGAKIILSQSGLEGKVQNFDGEWLDLSEEVLYDEEGSTIENIVRPSGAAYVIYTSGSTGKPKGVVVEHRNLINFCLWYRDFYNLKSSDIQGAYCNFTFDVSVGELFPPLTAGTAVHVIPEEIRLSPGLLNDYYEKNHVTTAILPTRIGEIFMENSDNKSLRVLSLVGEKMNRYKSGRYMLINAYGPTETTIYAVTAVIEEYSGNIPIGRPTANTLAYVVDNSGRLVPIGVEGELWLSGAQVARGYLNRPRLTEEKFIKNPFAAGDIDERIYKTGDLVRWLPSGNLEFIGRIDGQVKIRGFRVETGEIEHEMLQFGGIKEAVVVDMDGQEGSKYLQAFITVKDSPDTGALTAALRRKLPDYMIPEQIMTLDTLPLTQSGKVDRVELRKLTKDHGLRYSAEVIHPKTSTERKMHGIWSELLRLEDISITESFFDAGGDSLMAIRLFLRIKEVFKLDLPVSTIYEINTIEQLSGLIDERKTEGVSPCVLIKDGEGGMPLFCIHDFSGEVLAYGRLAHCLEEGRPVYGIRYSSKEDGRTADLESLASDYIRQIKHIQPKGPYHLLGYSAGGAIAYEMALQLAESGEKTATLAFLDTPNYSKYPAAVKNIFYAVAKYGLNWLRALSFKDSIQFIAVNTKAVVRDIFRGLSRNKREEYRTFAVQKSLQRMLSHYVPRYYEGRVTLFRAVKRSIKMDERLGWGGLVKEIEVYETSGNHVSIMNKDNLNIIAEVLRDQYRKDEVL